MINESITTLSSLSFTETMKGVVTFNEQDGELNVTLLLHLTVYIHDIERFRHTPSHHANIEGYLECPALGGRRKIDKGMLYYFRDEESSRNTRMWYHLFFSDASGSKRSLIGFKEMPGKMGLNVWRATTTLFVSLHQSEEGNIEEGNITEEPGQTMATGTISLHFLDFLRQLTSFRIKRAMTLWIFLLFFLRELGRAYSGASGKCSGEREGSPHP
ncbi:hypothetical protein KSF_093790 [Reticulibacter mediterranei]|uniref:Uncharacterized protein n=1 Tax=Reticulibacter mediterranei TaxID=2778369 RepID=A0A8J3J0G0_9CHLR|nr:hypothetical protein [Reticulibacter mediterranei]GHO99331.1 hypothetical protein KSF_093790 [Reticulibacter mediterranei]